LAQIQVEKIELASGARSATYTGVQRENVEFADIIEVFCDLTAFVTTASLTLSIEAHDAAKGGFVSILAATALTAVGSKRLIVGPSVPTAANASLTAIVPMRYRIVATHGNGNSHTYSISVALRGSPN
jgi:hypothetical protein